MIILRQILVLFLLNNFVSLYADQIDIGIVESTTIPGQIDIKIRPDFDIYTPQTITAILYTVRWDDPSISINTQSFYPFFISHIGLPEEYNGYYYQSFAAIPFNSVAINANQEFLASSFTYTNGDCATFEIIEDEWTQANNGNLYLEFIGTDVSGIIYHPFVSFGSIGGNIIGNDTIFLGNSTGPMNLINYQGSVTTWQRKIDDNLWMDIPGTMGLELFSDTPLIIGSYNYRTKVQNGTCPEVFSEILNIQVVSHDEIELSLKVFLEGGFLIEEMGTFLNQQDYIPLNQPYSTSPWFYDGKESVDFIPNNNVTDWILVELRETTGGALNATPDKLIARQAGFLLKNGIIVDTDGSSNLKFAVTIYDNLYVLIWHRNHLGVMSAVSLTLLGNIYNYDFTIGNEKSFGGNLGHKEVKPGIWAMRACDASQDGQINNIDKNDIWLNQIGLSGYLESDFDMDSEVSLTDKTEFWDQNLGKKSYVPD